MSNISGKIFFSIITPSYNSDKKLIRAIDSLQNNKVSFEHIIVDDCSTDGSFESAKQYCYKKELNNYFFYKNACNQGPGHARNKGLSMSRGKYILFLDADDYFKPCALDDLAMVIENQGYPDVVSFGYSIITENGDIRDVKINIKPGMVSGETALKDFILDKIISAPWCKAIKSNIAKSTQFPNMMILEDSVYNLNVFNSINACYYMNLSLYLFDKSENNSLTRKPFTREEANKIFQSWVVFENIYKSIFNKSLYSSLLAIRRIRFICLNFIYRQVISGSNLNDKQVESTIKRIFLSSLYHSLRYIKLKEAMLCGIFLINPRLARLILARRTGR